MTFAAVARPISDGIYARLDSGLGAVPLGDGIAPADPGSPALYAVLDHMDGTVRSDLDESDHLVKHVVQVRSVGASRNAAQHVQDLARSTLLARDLVVPGVKLMQVTLEVGGRVAPENDADPSTLFVAMDRFALHFDTRS